MRGRLVSRFSLPLAIGVVAIGVAAVVDAVSGGDDAGETGPPAAAVADEPPAPAFDGRDGFLPAPGALPGRLLAVDAESCRLTEIDLEQLTVNDLGPETGCRAWFGPYPVLAAVRDWEGGGTWLVDASEKRYVSKIMDSVGPVTFSLDGAAHAHCVDDRVTLVVSVADGTAHEVPGCRAVFGRNGSVLTRAAQRLPTTLLRDGQELLGKAELEGGLPAEPEGAFAVIGYDEGDDGALAIAVARFPGRGQDVEEAPWVQPKVTLQLWREGLLESTVPVRSVTTGFGSLVELSPSGNEVLIASTNPGALSVVDLRARDQRQLQRQQFGAAWSPDGSWLAIALPGWIEIRSVPTFELVYRLPLAVRGLAWPQAESDA